MKLVYDAMDWQFADRAVYELRAAGIPCHLARPSDSPPDEDTAEAVPDAPATYTEPDPKDFEETPEEAMRREADETAGGPIFGRASVPIYPIYVDRDEDYQRASDILIKLGAARDVMLKESTIEALNYWSIAFAVVAAVVVLLFILENRR